MTEAPPSKPGQEDPAQSDHRALGLHGWSDQAQEALAWPVKEERAPRKGIDRERIEQGVIEQGRIGQEKLRQEKIGQEKLGQEELRQEELKQESAEEDEYDPIVEIGDMVEIHFQGNPESAKRFVVGEEDAVVDGKTIERVRVNYPLGRALLDASLDDDVEYLVGASAKTATIARIVKGVAPRETRAAGPSPSPASKPSSGPSPSHSTGPPSGEASSPPRVASGDPPRASGGAPYDPALSDVYDEGLTASLAEWLCDLIDKEGPVRLDCLLKLAAQAHGGLKRVTGRFKSRVASVLEGLRTATETNGETVYWPRGRSPEKSIPYRKFDTDGRRRGWEILPYPERLGLALKAVGWSGPAAMKASIGFMLKELGRSNVPQSTRAEMAVVVKEAIKELG